VPSSFRQTIVRRSRSAGTYVNGRYTQVTSDNGTIQGSIQPLTPDEVEQLPEGRRDSQSFWIYTDTKLNTVTSENPDLLLINSEEYEVNKENIWQNDVIPHYRYLVIKLLES